MSIDLILEVMDHAPADLTSGERLVLVVIAERANEKTRQARQSERWTIDTIAERAGMKRSGVKAALQGLAKKGCEVRVPVKHDAKGRPVFAFEGTAMTFQIPRLAKRGGHSIPSQRGDHSIPSDAQERWPQHPRGVAVASERGGHSHPQSLKEPSKNPQTPSPLPPVDASKPSSTSPQEEGEGSFDEDERTNSKTIAGELIDPYRSDLTVTQARDLTRHVVDALGRGWPSLAIAQEFDRDLTGLNDIGRGLIGRAKKLGDPPAEHELATTTQCAKCRGAGRYLTDGPYGTNEVVCECRWRDSDAKCPIHPRNRAMACHSCWADVKAGQDPYRDRENERPDGWREQYRLDGQRRSGERESKVNGQFGQHKASWDRRRQSTDDRVMSTGERRLTQALDVAAELDAAPVYHPDHPRRLINSHADQDRYDENL